MGEVGGEKAALFFAEFGQVRVGELVVCGGEVVVALGVAGEVDVGWHFGGGWGIVGGSVVDSRKVWCLTWDDNICPNVVMPKLE